MAKKIVCSLKGKEKILFIPDCASTGSARTIMFIKNQNATLFTEPDEGHSMNIPELH